MRLSKLYISDPCLSGGMWKSQVPTPNSIMGTIIKVQRLN